MARYTGPKHKLARREGINILGKNSPSLARRLNVIPGAHGRRRRKLSEYGIQLREKQKIKRIYGVLEKQFKKYVLEAQAKKINTEDALVGLLETRLDNMVYRLGFAKTRFQSRQMVSHKHVRVNGQKINIPSYPVRVNDVISISDKFFTTEEARTALVEAQLSAFVAREALSGKLVFLPGKDDVQNPVDYQLVIEFYSR